MIVEGEAACKWTESSGTGNNRRSTVYHGEEKYLNSVTYLFGSKDGENMEVVAGIHTYNFTCLLPVPIPYSLEGKHGHVRYKVDVNLDIPWAFDLTAEKPFTVVRHEDLNVYPELRMPIEFEEITAFCCWCCKSDPLIIKICIPKTGFALGEKIPLKVELVNKSSMDVTHTTFTLKRVEKFNSRSPFEKTKVIKEEVVEKKSKGVKGGDTATFEEFVEIPQILSTSNDKLCKVFQVTYELKFKIEADGMSVSPDANIPITIGSVALQNDGYQNFNPPPFNQQSFGMRELNENISYIYLVLLFLFQLNK